MAEANALEIEALVPLAAAIGESWAHERAVDLRANERDVVGAWPGTVREARLLVLARIPAMRAARAPDPDALQLLARAAYTAARRSWEAISEPDPEP